MTCIHIFFICRYVYIYSYFISILELKNAEKTKNTYFV